jgi:hypothetical protein
VKTHQQWHLRGITGPGGRAHLQRRSTLAPPPIGERSAAWGKYDTVQDIMSRPLPPPAIQQGQNTTLRCEFVLWPGLPAPEEKIRT